MLGVEGLTGTLLFSVVVAALGSAFQHGYNTGVVNAPHQIVKQWIVQIIQPNATINSTSTELETQATFIYSTVVSIYCLGGMVGGFLTSTWSNIFGRKWAIISNNLFIFISAALMGLSKSSNSYLMLIAGRFIVGINSGLNAGLVPMYLSEIPPIALRGGMGSTYQLFLTISILISQVLSNKGILGDDDGWPILFSLIAIPAILQVLLLPFCGDSPRYLQERGNEDSAKAALQWFRGTEDVQTEIDLLKSEAEADKAAGSVSLVDLFTNPVVRTPLIISCAIMLGQQFSGINAVIFYSTSTFKEAELSTSEAQLGTMLIGLMNVLMTVVSTVIVDKAGRKTLLSVGFGAMFIDTIILCVCLTIATTSHSISAAYASIVFLVLFVVFFAIGPGSIPWFLVSEFFLLNARQKAISIAVAVNWIGNYVVSLTFPTLQSLLKSYVFVIFAVFQLIILIYILMKVPETKNRTIEDITSEFKTDKADA